jgi:hypothetical protein
MIKFFRKIRQNLLSEGKTGKYFKYAIGEVVLVVIGILIALNINNWNEKQKDRVIEQDILVQLLEEYETNLKQLENKIQLRNIIIKSSIEVLGYIDSPININKDSLIKKIATLRYDPTFDPIQNDLISSGNIRLIQNKNLRKMLSNWSSDVVAVQEMERQWEKIRSETNIPYMIKLGIYRDIIDITTKEISLEHWLLDNIQKSDYELSVGKSKRINIEDILNDKDLESMVGHAINFNNVTNLQSNALLIRINKIIKILNEELNND